MFYLSVLLVNAPSLLILTKQVEQLVIDYFIVGVHDQTVRAGLQEPVIGTGNFHCATKHKHS